MINSFKNFLVEEEKTIYLVWGRLNPPTAGHEKLLDFAKQKAGKNPYRIYLTQSVDKKKNPLDYKTKVKFARKGFPKHARQIIMDPKIKTIFDALTTIYNEGYKKIVVVAGGDRHREYSVLFPKYNGKKGRHGLFNFENISVLNAGDRDPEASGVEGVSGTKLRGFAEDGDFSSFAQFMPKALSNAETKTVFNAVREGLGLKAMKETTQHIQLEKVSDTREAYVSGNLYNVGDYVLLPEEQESGYITHLGPNYVVVEANGKSYRKWIDSIVLFESKEDPDIGHRKGSQPAGYHKGLSKSTKIARDQQFKRQSKMSDDDPSAYKPAPGDKDAKTKPSKHTKKFKQMYDEGIEDVRGKIAREREIERRKDAADRKRYDRMLDRARTALTRKVNTRTK